SPALLVSVSTADGAAVENLGSPDFRNWTGPYTVPDPPEDASILAPVKIIGGEGYAEGFYRLRLLPPEGKDWPPSPILLGVEARAPADWKIGPAPKNPLGEVPPGIANAVREPARKALAETPPTPRGRTVTSLVLPAR